MKVGDYNEKKKNKKRSKNNIDTLNMFDSRNWNNILID